MPELDQALNLELSKLASAGLRRELRPVNPSVGSEIPTEERTLLNFASNDYLGLSRHPKVIEAATRAARDWGGGSCASRLICGSLQIHHQLEEALAAWKGVAAALSFASGYATALGVIPALIGGPDVVVIDKRIHACCIDGARLSGATLRVFRHNDLDSLESILRWADQRRGETPSLRILVITESVFSMDGDQAPLAAIVELKERYGAWLMLDEAHALGLLGDNRSGLARATGLEHRVDIHLGTLGKALGSAGGYVAGSRVLIDFLIQRARSFMFSTAPVPAAAASAQAALELVQSAEGATRSKSAWNQARKVAALTQPGQPPSSTILPVILGDEETTLNAAARLHQMGLWVPAIRYPTVARGMARLRVTVTSAHTDQEVTRLMAALGSIHPVCIQ